MAQGKRHNATGKRKKEVERLSGLGLRYEDIASILEISSDTLVKYYTKELKKGRGVANSVIAESLFKKAENGDTVSQIFWLKTRGGFVEEKGDNDREAIELVKKLMDELGAGGL